MSGTSGSPADRVSTEGYPWHSETVLAAELDGDGTIERANPALARLAQPGTPFEALLTPAQRAAFRERLADAGPGEWTRATFAFVSDPARPAVDRTVWLRQGAVIAEPAVGEQERLVEKVLELNDDLVGAHRELVRQRERIRRLEAISAAGLAHVRLDEVLEDVLRTIAGAVGAEHAAILLADERGGLHVKAEVGGPREQRASDADVTAVPLRLEGMVLGVLEVQGGRGEEDRALLAPAAERAAVAIGRAQVHERERSIAETLQRALLPDRLPEVDGLELAARFLPGAQVEVGGDWYDALPLAAGGLAVAIGDVAGKGVRAAALMGEIRSGLRAYALDGGEPHEILARLDAFVSRSQRMATVLLALVDPGTGAVRFASAGHLPPLVVHPDGRAELVAGGRAAPLLVYRPAAPAGFDLPAGGSLVLYTDGLVERRGEPIDAGLERLRAAAAGHRGGAAALCDRLLRAMHDGDGARDDTAIIAIHRP